MVSEHKYINAIFNANLDYFSGNVLEGIIQGKISLYNAIHYLECMLDLGWTGKNIDISYIRVLVKEYKDTPTEDLLNDFVGVLEANLYGKAKRENAIKILLAHLKLEVQTLFPS